MTIDINELRKVIADCYWPTSPVTIKELLDRLEAAERDVALKERVIDALGSELNAVAKERDDVAQQLVQSEIGKREISEAHNAVTRRLSALADENAALIDDMNLLRNNNMALRAKIEAMEQQKPVEWQARTRPAWNDGTWGPWRKCSEEYAEDIKKTPLLHDWLYEARTLYTLPGAKTQGEEK